MRVSISTKLILITSVILISVTGPIALVTSKYFENTFRQREENVNLDYAAARATEVENILTDIVFRTRTAGAALLRTTNDVRDIADFQDGFLHDNGFLAIEVQKYDGTVVATREKDALIRELCNCDSGSVRQAHVTNHFPFNRVRDGQVEVQNTTVPGGPPMFTIGIPLVKDENGRITHIAVADLDLGVIQRPFRESTERAFYAVDRQGTLLAHSDERRAVARQDFSKSEIVKMAEESKLPRGQRHVEDPAKTGHVYSAFAKTSFGISVFSEIPDEIIFEPAREVKRQVLFISGMALSAALFVIFLFSMTLTAPIEHLVDLTEEVSRGNFNVRASSIGISPLEDEVGQLATAFDQMTDGLKERDKVKMLFTKFHGSSIAADLMSRKMTLDGENKDVLVFFSDIRGFTSFSERRDPKEVFVMLNEYFQEMVNIVNKNGGVVDKFIGDAIMAVWGAPKASENDAYNAVLACLQMRKALNELNDRRMERGHPPLLIGMGLHAGPAISGIIGSSERMEYTVIGNTVNTTSRVEAATKSFGVDLLITSEVASRVGDRFKIQSAGAAEVKGRSEALKLYKVLGYTSNSGEFVEVRTPYSSYAAEEDAKVHVAGGEGAGDLPADGSVPEVQQAVESVAAVASENAVHSVTKIQAVNPVSRDEEAAEENEADAEPAVDLAPAPPMRPSAPPVPVALLPTKAAVDLAPAPPKVPQPAAKLPPPMPAQPKPNVDLVPTNSTPEQTKMTQHTEAMQKFGIRNPRVAPAAPATIEPPDEHELFEDEVDEAVAVEPDSDESGAA